MAFLKMLFLKANCFRGLWLALCSHTSLKRLVHVYLMVFLEVKCVVEIEVRKSETGTEKASSTNLDVNEIIGKVRDFVGSIREMSPSGQPMSVSVEGFNVSVGKANGEYEFSLKLSLVFKPKAAAASTTDVA